MGMAQVRGAAHSVGSRVILMTGRVEAGEGFSSEEIGSSGNTIWVCFGRSELNDHILRLAPVVDEKVSDRAVAVRSMQGDRKWMVPEIEIAIHEQLILGKPSHRYSVVPGEIPESGSHAKAAKYFELLREGRSLEGRLHEPPKDNVYPRLDQCTILGTVPRSDEFNFVWEPDQRRHYVLRRYQGEWKIHQAYDFPDASERPVNDGLIIGDRLLEFDESGTSRTPLSRAMLFKVLKRFGVTRSISGLRSLNILPIARFLSIVPRLRVQTAAAAAAILLALTVILLSNERTSEYEIAKVYVSSDFRSGGGGGGGGVGSERILIVEVEAKNIEQTSREFEDSLRELGADVSRQLVGKNQVILIGEGPGNYRAFLDRTNKTFELNVDDVVRVEVVITLR